MNFSQIHQARFKRIQELAMEFSPDEDIRSVLAKSTTDVQPNPGDATLSRRAENRVRRDAIYITFFPLKPGAAQAESQAGEIEGEA